MNPDDIKKHFGEDALNMLYDCILENPVHYLADWILSYHSEQEIGAWILNLREEENE
jgi:hypothetical protein